MFVMKQLLNTTKTVMLFNSLFDIRVFCWHEEQAEISKKSPNRIFLITVILVFIGQE